MELIDADELMTEIMDSDLDHLQRDDWREVIQIVQDAPTIQTRRKTGRWIESNLIPSRKGKQGGRLFICSECGKGWTKQDRSMDGINFCPNCGADMSGEQDG